MPLLNRAEIDRQVAEFRRFCDNGAPAPAIASDKALYDDITQRAFACGAEWANMPETIGDEAKAVATLVAALVTGFKSGLAIRERNAADDAVLSANQIG